MKISSAVTGIVLGAMLLSGCSSTKESSPEKIQKVVINEQKEKEKDRSLAMQLFIDGSLKESKGQFADAILDYQEALRYDQNASIYFALAKNYAALKRYISAVENAQIAVAMDSAKVEYRELLAQIYIYSGQFDKAIQEYRKILTIDSEHVNSLFTLAQLQERSNPSESLALYEKILQKKGPSWEILLQIAQINSALQRYEKAAEAYEEMLKLDPGNISLKQNLADMYMRLKQYEKSKKIINDVLENNPDNLFLRASLVDVYFQQNKWDSARVEMETILKADSLDPDLHFRIGIAFFTQSIKDSTVLEDAINIFKRFEQTYPTDWRSHLYLGVLYRQQKKDSIAAEYLSKATTTANWNGDAWWQLGWLYFDRQDFKETIDVMNKAKNYVPEDFRIHMLLGIAYNRAGMHQDSRIALERAYELNPNDVNVLSSLGLTYDALKMHAESDSAYERALRIDPGYALVLNNYAYSLSERDMQLQRALKMSEESLKKDSTNAAYLDTYGWIMFKLGRYEEAEYYIKKAVETGEASAVVLEHLGDVYEKLNRMEEAKQYWTKALDKDQHNTALREKLER